MRFLSCCIRKHKALTQQRHKMYYGRLLLLPLSNNESLPVIVHKMTLPLSQETQVTSNLDSSNERLIVVTARANVVH